MSALYQDPSIGNQVNIAVVNVILLDEEAHLDGLNITVNADKTLESFCKWQEQQNFEGDDHPNHHDVAILITRWVLHTIHCMLYKGYGLSFNRILLILLMLMLFIMSKRKTP